MAEKMISIATEYSSSPAGRYRTDGPFSGQRFREDVLLPALESFDRVIVNLDGAFGYGSSFLEEAFGGLVRSHSLTLDKLRKTLEVRCAVDLYIKRIWRYIEDADAKRK